MALMVQTTQRCFEVHQPILRVLTKTLFIAGYSTTTTTNIYLQEWVGSVKGRKVLSQRLVPYTNSMKRKSTTQWWEAQKNGLTSQTVGRFQMGANILLKPAPHPWWLLASISWCIYTAALMDWLLELLLNAVPITRTGEHPADPQPHT